MFNLLSGDVLELQRHDDGGDILAEPFGAELRVADIRAQGVILFRECFCHVIKLVFGGQGFGEIDGREFRHLGHRLLALPLHIHDQLLNVDRSLP